MLGNGKTIPTTPIILDKDVTPTILEAAVDNISQWRQGMVSVVESTKVASKQLQKDNVQPEKVVKANLQLIKKAESHGVIQKFTTLNDEFTERIKEENKEIDKKIKAIKSKMGKEYKKR
ncbi:hypothetical protein RhiirA4_473658 [Rhizophagus irregularis]|uniref:Uncharacterized protein n=1 Tax=Rhizophagus irregularis TaxID=588596 RepID=A0A2I1H751_9GLOM|nr:hypothetical protein RhiirA4_473658 [Rhizophagus irregularis]